MFCHPEFLASQSMPRFARMLKSGFEQRGHVVTMWFPKPKLRRLFPAGKLSKWAGYVDQYMLFPLEVRRALKGISGDSLFVFCDQALGPWVPLVRTRPHVVHAHDLLALRSAMGDFGENPTSFTGRVYQRYIRRGFRKGRHFISVSNKTRDDLHRYGQVTPLSSNVVYNALNFPYRPMPKEEARAVLEAEGFPTAPDGMLMHLGGGQWYKNRVGVIAIYSQYANKERNPLPLWCIGAKPDAAVQQAVSKVGKNGRVLFFPSIASMTLQAAYSYARVFLFPSLEEGFGWPIVEAQACGCPVITTNEPPMTEVAGAAAFYLPRLQYGGDVDAWAAHGAVVLQQALSESAEDRKRRTEQGLIWARRFDADRATHAYLAIYEKILGLSSM